MTTPVDPGAIDGLPCECRFYSIEGAIRAGSETDELVDPDEPIRECALHKALRERVAELESQVADGVRRSLNCQEWQARAEAAEARAVELAEALEDLLQWHRNEGSETDEPPGAWLKRAYTTLSATPAKALERARGFEQLARGAISDLRRYARDNGSERRMVSVQAYEKALAKLDALGEEEGHD